MPTLVSVSVPCRRDRIGSYGMGWDGMGWDGEQSTSSPTGKQPHPMRCQSRAQCRLVATSKCTSGSDPRLSGSGNVNVKAQETAPEQSSAGNRQDKQSRCRMGCRDMGKRVRACVRGEIVSLDDREVHHQDVALGGRLRAADAVPDAQLDRAHQVRRARLHAQSRRSAFERAHSGLHCTAAHCTALRRGIGRRDEKRLEETRRGGTRRVCISISICMA